MIEHLAPGMTCRAPNSLVCTVEEVQFKGPQPSKVVVRMQAGTKFTFSFDRFVQEFTLLQQ